MNIQSHCPVGKIKSLPNRAANMNKTNYSQPGFYKQLQMKIKNGRPITNNIFIVLGTVNAYLKAKNLWKLGNVALTFDPDSGCSSSYSWLVAKQPVLILDFTYDGIETKKLKRLAYELLGQGATLVTYITPDYRLIKFGGEA